MPTRPWIVLAPTVLAAITAMGCPSRDAGDDPDACPGPPPAIDTCFRGNFFAECGGAGPPRFACNSSSDCRWFSDGCVPVGYEPSPCPAEELCCLANWPFPEPGLPDGVYQRLVAFGRLPWDRDRAMNVEIAVDPAVPPGDDSYTCTGVDPNGGRDPNNPCNGWFGPHSGRVRNTFSFNMNPGGVSGWFPWVEVDFARPPGPKARVCQQVYVDHDGSNCPIHQDIACASAGRVTLSRLPLSDAEVADVYGALDVTFDNGFRLEGSFAIRLF